MTEGSPGKEGDITRIKEGLQKTVKGASYLPATTVLHIFGHEIFRSNISSEKIGNLIRPTRDLSVSRKGTRTKVEDNEVIHSLLGTKARFLSMSPSEIFSYQTPGEEIEGAFYTQTDSSFHLRLQTSIEGLDYHVKLSSGNAPFQQGDIYNFSHRLLNRTNEASQGDFDPDVAKRGLEKAVEGAKLYPGTVVDHAFPFSIIINKDIRRANIETILTSDVFYELDMARQREMELLKLVLGEDALSVPYNRVGRADGTHRIIETDIPNLYYHFIVDPHIYAGGDMIAVSHSLTNYNDLQFHLFPFLFK